MGAQLDLPSADPAEPFPAAAPRTWNDPRAPERLRAALARLESEEPLS